MTNAVTGSILAAGLFAMVLAGSNSLGPSQALADTSQAPAVAASDQRGDETRILSAFELMIRLAPDQLPVEQVAEPF